MAGSFSWLPFVALYALVVLRLSHDLRHGLDPWLKRRLAPKLGVVAVSWLSIGLAMLGVFLPAACLGMLAHLRTISWALAQVMLVVSLVLSCATWMLPRSDSRSS